MYVDLTVGSFVCTDCSGLLRGLRQPHRVKSKTHGTFSSEELGLLRQQRGNEGARALWMAGWDERDSLPGKQNQAALKKHLSAKYERKRWCAKKTEPQRSGPAPSEQPMTSRDSFGDLRPSAARGATSSDVDCLRFEDIASINSSGVAAQQATNPAVFVNQSSTAPDFSQFNAFVASAATPALSPPTATSALPAGSSFGLLGGYSPFASSNGQEQAEPVP